MAEIIYAGDREISVKVLEFIIGQGVRPCGLMVGSGKSTSHAEELLSLCRYLDDSRILKGDLFRTKDGMKILCSLKPDYIICVHFPYIVPKEVLSIPKHGVLNLHPAYLPYNRGWHTPSWAIWEKTPYGGTLHFMDEGIDTGDIIHQKKIDILPSDTADSIYRKTLSLELDIFKEVWPFIASERYFCKKQPVYNGSVHTKKDIASIQHVDLDEKIKAGDLIRRLKALTTNNIKEAAYFKEGGKAYRMQIKITEDSEE